MVPSKSIHPSLIISDMVGLPYFSLSSPQKSTSPFIQHNFKLLISRIFLAVFIAIIKLDSFSVFFSDTKKDSEKKEYILYIFDIKCGRLITIFQYFLKFHFTIFSVPHFNRYIFHNNSVCNVLVVALKILDFVQLYVEHWAHIYLSSDFFHVC